MRWFLIDAYYGIVPGETLRAKKMISHNEEFYNYYQPFQPSFPATLQIEMMAQAGGVLSGISQGFQKEVVLGKIEQADFSKVVTPPSELIIDAKLAMVEESFSWAEMVMRDAAGEVARSKIMFAFLDTFGVGPKNESLVFTDDFLRSYGLTEYKRKKLVK